MEKETCLCGCDHTKQTGSISVVDRLVFANVIHLGKETCSCGFYYTQQTDSTSVVDKLANSNAFGLHAKKQICNTQNGPTNKERRTHTHTHTHTHVFDLDGKDFHTKEISQIPIYTQKRSTKFHKIQGDVFCV